MSLSALQRTDISAIEEANLVQVVRQTISAQVGCPETGKTLTRYFPTTEQDEALTALISAYIQDIRKAARTARVIDRDDAEAVALEKFISLARSATRTNERLAGFVSRAMVNAVMDADAEASAVRIPPDTLRRYFNIVREAGSIDAAYIKCRDEANNFDAITLLAVHRALNAESAEALQEKQDEDGGPSTAFEAAGATPSHEEAVVQEDLVRWLLASVPDAQEVILRLAYGFTDTRSETLRVRAGYQWDECLSDAQISPVVAASRAKVQRERTTALRAMGARIQGVVDESA